jgi:beta-ureidopropionase / N-carbamoyl-L-amino-acid hydrolase
MNVLPNLKINPQRLWDDLMETAQIGANAKGGIRRLTLSDEDRQVRDWFRRACERLGCAVAVDDCGNMFARRPGRRNDLPPIVMGSHLDTQPTGGKFDGVLGVLGALEVLRTLHEMDYETNAPIEIANWTNEEGSRFAPAMLASGVFAGVFSRDYAVQREDRDGKRFGDELERIGYLGDEPVGQRRIGAYFELHIEQGPILEAEGSDIGVVTGVQGMRWYEVRVRGQSAHTGATPMHLRKDALLGAARVVEEIHRIAMRHAPDAVGTVGLLEVEPNSRNVVPGDVFFCVDLRHRDETVLQVMEEEFRALLLRVMDTLGLSFTEAMIWNSPAVRFDADLIACVRAGAARAGFSTRDLVSGAGHDAAYIARVAPATMIFVPSAGGISHNEAESTSFDECGNGAQALLEAVLACDQRFG